MVPLGLQERAAFGAVDLEAAPVDTNRHYCLRDEATTDSRLILRGKPGDLTVITIKINGKITQLTSWKPAGDTLVGQFSHNQTSITITATDSSWEDISFTSDEQGKTKKFNLRMM